MQSLFRTTGSLGASRVSWLVTNLCFQSVWITNTLGAQIGLVTGWLSESLCPTPTSSALIWTRNPPVVIHQDLEGLNLGVQNAIAIGEGRDHIHSHRICAYTSSPFGYVNKCMTLGVLSGA